MVKKLLISYAIGAIAGGSAVYILTRTYYKNLADEEIKSVKEMVLRRTEELCSKEKNLDDKIVAAIEYVDKETSSIKEDEEDHGTKTSTNYSSFYKGGGEVEGVLNSLAEQEHPTEDDVKAKKNKKKNGPKIIKAEDFDGCPEYRKISVYFYWGDKQIADENDETELEDLNGKKLGKYNDLIGDCMNKFGFVDNDNESVLYVRNEGVGTDFEIIKDFGTFADIKGVDL